MLKSGSDLIKKNDVILICLMAAVAIIAYLIWQFAMPSGKTAVIRVDGEIVKTLSLNKDCEEEIPLTDGKNKLQIKDGKVRMTSADCPDKICVNHRAISHEGETIVCLPHKLVIEIEGESPEDEENSIDVYTK